MQRAGRATEYGLARSGSVRGEGQGVFQITTVNRGFLSMAYFLSRSFLAEGQGVGRPHTVVIRNKRALGLSLCVPTPPHLTDRLSAGARRGTVGKHGSRR